MSSSPCKLAREVSDRFDISQSTCYRIIAYHDTASISDASEAFIEAHHYGSAATGQSADESAVMLAESERLAILCNEAIAEFTTLRDKCNAVKAVIGVERHAAVIPTDDSVLHISCVSDTGIPLTRGVFVWNSTKKWYTPNWRDLSTFKFQWGNYSPMNSTVCYDGVIYDVWFNQSGVVSGCVVYGAKNKKTYTCVNWRIENTV